MEGAEVERPTWSRASSRREFLRTYKACMSCRQRKAKCELGGNNDRGIPPGPPCLRCRREQRNCQFSEDRAWARKKKKAPFSTTTAATTTNTTNAGAGQIAGADADTEEANQVNQSAHDGLYSVSNAGDTPSSTGHHFHNIPGAAGGAPNSNTSTASGHTSMHFDPVGRAAPATPANMSSTGSLSPVLTSSTTNNAHRRDYRGSSSDRLHAGAQSSSSHGLHTSVMRTVVSSGNDALNILFQAAAQEQDNEMIDIESTDRRPSISKEGGAWDDSHAGIRTYDTPTSTTSYGGSPTSDPTQLSHVEPDVLAVWDQCRFVKMGWFSSREAVTYVDMFFKNMAPLSPILSHFYSHHRNHYWLISQEPVLCCTILMISSRYHTLPGVGGASRGFFIHQRLWQHCQHLIMRVMLGQEKGSKAKTRTVGTIEALLVMSEWHPRSLHFPPESDGWDSDLMMDNTPEHHDSTSPDSSVSASSRWLEDVIEPARRSDRMSWMLLGSGLTLAHELGIFDTDDSRAKSLISSPEGEHQGFPVEETMNFPRHRIRQLLYVFINQLASRLGCMSLMPQSLNHSIVAPSSLNTGIDEWQTFMNSWIELTKLAKSVTDMFFPSATFTRQQLHSGRYIGLLDHFRPLLSQWRQKHLDSKHLSRPFGDMIFIEYQFVRVYTNSIGMQAVVERVLNESDPDVVMDDVRQANMDEIDYEFIQEVIDGSCSLLQKVTTLAENGALRFSPVRIFLRITSSSIFLLKALSLGVRNAKLQESLDILTKSIQALRSSSLDDIHLASRYATLLDSLLSRLRRSFVLSNKNPKVSRSTTRPSSVTPLSKTQNASPATQGLQASPQQPQQQQQQQQQQLPHPLQQTQVQQYSPGGVGSAPMNSSMDVSNNPVFEDPISSLNDISADDWLSLPFDPSMAPFGDGGNQAWSGFEGANLNFIWNLPL
ncbi:C6 transcription factor [Trichophyton equinum CBS 127.97]|uniref:C6 transcription factor n=1 Tax=Trichophyton equinum (strain ATCC MYA-4606 / CBS 127.97) TaxID=559882 RepID=F2PRC7_TRIEC|nr:C6 transcription factor [Trichophyton equinum CBS 127.97]